MRRLGAVWVIGLAWAFSAGTGAIGMAQVQQARYLKSNQTSKRMSGSAKRLQGVTNVYHIFCNDSESSWSSAQKSAALRRMQDAISFIKLQSQAYGIRADFTETIGRDIFSKHALPAKVQANHAWTEEVIRRSTGTSGRQVVNRAIQNDRADNAVICLHINKPALSYNLAHYKNVNAIYAAERMVCFSAYPDGRETCTATYAHEILHLFGAGDLYFPYDKTGDRKRRAGQLFPDDVMYRVDYDLGRLNIGAYTAFRIGWTGELSPRLTVFDD